MTETNLNQKAKPRLSAARFLPPLLAALLVALLAYGLMRPSPDARLGSVLLDKPAPEFSLTSLDEETVSLASMKGPPCCHEDGTTWKCYRAWRASFLGSTATRPRWRYEGPSTTRVCAPEVSRSMADWARSASVVSPSHSAGSRFDTQIVLARRWRSTTIS